MSERATIVAAAKGIATDLLGCDGVTAQDRLLELLSRMEVELDGITTGCN